MQVSGSAEISQTASHKKLMRNLEDSEYSLLGDTLEFSSIIIPLHMLNKMFSMAIYKYCGNDSLHASAVKNEFLVSNIQVICSCGKSFEFWAGDRVNPKENSVSTFTPFSINRHAVMSSSESGSHYSGLSQMLASLYLPNMHHKSYQNYLKYICQTLKEVYNLDIIYVLTKY